MKQHFGQSRFNKALAHFLIDQQAPDSADRVALITGFYPEAANDILTHVDDFVVDILYLDGGKTTNAVEHGAFVKDALTGALQAFPNIVLSGDDYHNKRIDDPQVFKETLREVSRISERQLYVARNRTWIMSSEVSKSVFKLGEKVG